MENSQKEKELYHFSLWSDSRYFTDIMDKIMDESVIVDLINSETNETIIMKSYKLRYLLLIKLEDGRDIVDKVTVEEFVNKDPNSIPVHTDKFKVYVTDEGYARLNILYLTTDFPYRDNNIYDTMGKPMKEIYDFWVTGIKDPSTL